VTVNSLPVVSCGADQTVCVGESVILNSLNTGTLIWDNGVINNVAFTPSVGSTTYTLTVFDLNQCEGVDQVIVNVREKVTPLFLVDDSICMGDIAPVLSQVSNDVFHIEGTWYPEVNVSSPGTSIYTFIPANGQCANTVLQAITVNPSPNTLIVNPLPVCAPFKVDLTSTAITSGVVDDFNYYMNSNGTEPIHSPNAVSTSGTYFLEQVSDLGCSSIFPVEVIIYPKPIASFNPSSVFLSSIDPKVGFENTSYLNVKNRWDFGDENSSLEDSPEHEYLIEDKYEFRVSLIVTSEMQCVDTAVAMINVNEELVYYVPNSFTPSGDGTNDEFVPVFTSGYELFNYSLLVFNRWGEVVFESNDASKGWDGTYGDKAAVQDGTYVWKISFVEKKTQKTKVITGNVNLIK
jgi:gliding motility-associated-like protein